MYYFSRMLTPIIVYVLQSKGKKVYIYQQVFYMKYNFNNGFAYLFIHYWPTTIILHTKRGFMQGDSCLNDRNNHYSCIKRGKYLIIRLTQSSQKS